MAVKSFRKRQGVGSSRVGGEIGEDLPFGTQTCPNNFTLVTSSGLSALDGILGGGLPVGSLFLVEEDEFGQYAESLAKFFISEGIYSGHKILYCGEANDGVFQLESLPGKVAGKRKEVEEQEEPGGTSQEEMKIAWRYNKIERIDKRTNDEYGRLALNLPLPSHLIGNAEIVQCQEVETMFEQLSKREFNANNQINRVVILGLGSPTWPAQKLVPTLYLLRGLLRKSLSVAFVTVPAHLHKEMANSWRHIADICMRLESFSGTVRASNAALKDFHGLLQIVKLPAFNSIAPHLPPSDLAFKLKRSTFLIEKLSLPPEMKETGNEIGCASSVTSNIDF